MREPTRRTRGIPVTTALLLSLVLFGAIAPGVRGAVPHVFEQLDEAFVEGDDVDKNTVLAQSFVATASYKLLAVDLFIYDLSISDIATVHVVRDSGGIPNGGLVASGTVDGSGGYEWLRVGLSPQAVLVTGNRYWIELLSGENPPHGYRWAKTVNSSYTAGSAAVFRGSSWNAVPATDYLFHTWGVAGPSITVGVSVDSSSAGPGDPLRYTVAFDNVGTNPASRVWINWTPSPDVAYVSDDALLNGGVRVGSGWVFDAVDVGPHSFHIDVGVDGDVFDGLPLTTTVFLEYADGSLMQEASQASTTTVARVPSLILSASAAPAFVGPGDNLTFRVAISNAGSREAGHLWVNDTLPPGVTYVSNSASSVANYSGEWIQGAVLHVNFTGVAPGVYAFDVNVTVNAGVQNGTWLVNWVFGNYTDSRDAVRPQVMASAIARVHGASVRVIQSVLPASAQPRETVRFYLRFDNAGNAVARNVWINDTLAPGLVYVSDTASLEPSFVGGSCAGSACSWAFADVAPGPHSITLTTTVAAGLPDGTVLANRADLAYTNSDGLPLDPSSATSSALVSRPAFTLAAVANGFANPGDRLGYYVDLENVGSGTARSVWMNVTVPAGAVYQSDNFTAVGGTRVGPWSWFLANLTTGAYALWLSLRVSTGLADGADFVVGFAVEHADEENNPGTPATDSVRTIITAPALLTLAYANRNAATGGELVTYTISIENVGSGIARDVWINNTLPQGATFVRSSLQYLSTSGTVYTWHLVDVAPGFFELNITIRVDGDVRPGSVLTDIVGVEYTDANGNRVDSWTGQIDVRIQDPLLTPGTTLPILVALLAALIGVLFAFIGWKVYGFGVRDKARIDELFLLHKSGELIRHLTRSLRPEVDSDVLSGMLVAVQNFVKESFHFVEGKLEEVKFGSHRIMLAHGKWTILAAVVAGRYTDRLAPALLSGLHSLEGAYEGVLKDWSGMPGEFKDVDEYLEAVLAGRVENGSRAPGEPVRFF